MTRALLVLTLSASLCAASVIAPSQARAQDPLDCIDELTEEELEVRLEWMTRTFDDRNAGSRAWWWTHLLLMTALGVGQTVIALNEDREHEIVRNAVGATGSYFIMLNLAFQPFLAAFGQRRLRRQPDSTIEERRDKLRYGTGMLQRSATQQNFQTGFLAYGSAVVYSSSLFTLMTVRYDEPLLGLLSAGSGLFITGLRLFSQPMHHVEANERWRGMACGSRYYERDEPTADDEAWDEDVPVDDEPFEELPDQGANAVPASTPEPASSPAPAPEDLGPSTSRYRPLEGPFVQFNPGLMGLSMTVSF